MPGSGADTAFDQAAYAQYSSQHGFNTSHQTSGGTTASVMFDTRDNAINAKQGWLASLWADKARVRRILMIWGVGIFLGLAGIVYLISGRYVTSDDSYVHANKLMVSTDVSGLVRPGARSRENAAVQATAALLGNTPSVARASYIHPAVLSAARHGRTVRDEVAAAAGRIGSDRLAEVWTDPGLQSAVRSLLP